MSRLKLSKAALHLILLLPWIPLISSETTSSSIALPGCQDHCGTTPIPYPFGIGPNCTHNSNPWFLIACNASHPNSPVPYSLNLTWQDPWFQSRFIPPIQILAVDLQSNSLQITGSYDSLALYYSHAYLTQMKQLDMRGSPFVLARDRNSLIVSGCGGSVILRNQTQEIVGGCSTVCADESLLDDFNAVAYRSCYGIGCCQTAIDNSVVIDYLEIDFLATINGVHNSSDEINAAIVDTSYIPTNRSSLYGSFLEDPKIPTVLEWRVPDLAVGSPEYANSVCELSVVKPIGYLCRCRYEYFGGNPYLPNGCQVVKECEECQENCVTKVDGTNNVTSYGCPSMPKKSELPIAIDT